MFWPHVAKLLLKLGRWTAVGPLPSAKKAVVVGVPHTSYWDGYWLLVYKVAYGLDVKFYVKATLFWFPLSVLLNGLGGVPLNRGKANRVVKQAVEAFNSNESYLLGISPEGTRSKTKGWKTGFYRIAEGAGVPIVFGFFDYKNRRLGFGPVMTLTGDMQADLDIFRSFYASVEGRCPEKTSPIQVLRSNRRPIRSYVRRSGRLTPSQQRALDELWPDFGIDFGSNLLDFDSIFKRAAPRIFEIGFGNGESLVQLAIDNPATDFLGVEVHNPGIGHCLIKARDAGIRNLRLISHDAIDVLETQIPSASLSRINLYFPDPWPKTRHHKRRIVQPEFLKLCADRLKSNGSLRIATDWENYAEHIDEVLGDFSRFNCVERREHGGDNPLDRAATKFEKRGLRHGHKIWDWQFERIAL